MYSIESGSDHTIFSLIDDFLITISLNRLGIENELSGVGLSHGFSLLMNGNIANALWIWKDWQMSHKCITNFL